MGKGKGLSTCHILLHFLLLAQFMLVLFCFFLPCIVGKMHKCPITLVRFDGNHFIYFIGFLCSSNFGPKLIMCSRGKLVTEKEVQPNDYSSHPIMETIVITLMHVAFHSEKVESEVSYNAILVCLNL